MADIKMLLHMQNYVGQDDDQADDDDYSKYYESSMLDQTNPDDLLSPLEKLRKYCTSENIFTRQMVARSIVETVQSISNEQECRSLLEIITKLSDDIEPSVRCELMEQLPPCSMMIVDMKIIPDAISTFILPVMVRYLTDANNQVRKLSQNALLQLMDQDLIKKDDVESQICPVILELTEPESSDDFRTEAVALMTKITCLLGAELTEKLFLDRFGRLCGDALFHVRKVCASNFGEMAAVVKRETTEKHLLRLFAHLCEDGVWGVRKACAETFMAVSGICSKAVRYETLSPLFVGLLCDKSRWVQMAAYQALGQFIATFAEPERSGFHVTEEGILVPYDGVLSRTFDMDSENESSNLEDPSLESDRQVSIDSASSRDHLCEPLSEDSSETFNNFEFWRLPSVDLVDEVSNNIENIEDDVNEVEVGAYNKGTTTTTSSSLVDNSSLQASPQGEAVKTYVIINSNTEDNRQPCVENTPSIPQDSTTTKNNNNNATPTTPPPDIETNFNTESEDVSLSDEIITDESNKTSINLNEINLEVVNSDDDDDDDDEDDEDDDDNSDNIVSGDNNINESGIEITVDSAATNNDSTDGSSDHKESAVECDMALDGGYETANDFYGMNQPSDEEHSDDDNTPLQSSNSHYSATLINNQTLHKQKIVPPALLEHFISMTEPSKAQTIDGDLPRHCAFTLPGVVLALGRDNWNLLRDTYVHLSTDMQWKVRRTLAFSIHDLALILGQKICVEDLVHVFNQFLKDLDEVRVGVLKHLFDFINILPTEQQKDYLPVFCEFQKTDNSRNWRFRKDLSEQLISLVGLYSEEELAEYLCSVALDLASDKVADVRENSFKLLCILLQKLYEYENAQLFHKFTTSIVCLGTHNQHWVKRKACSQIYSRFLDMPWYDTAHFARDFLPSLLHLCADVVPNVRLISSKSLLAISNSDYYQCLPEADEVRKDVDRALENLQLDEDRDVRFFAGGKVEEHRGGIPHCLEDTIPVEEDMRYFTSDKANSDKFQNMTLEMALDSDSDAFSYQHGVRIIQRGIHEYAINDDDDDDAELVEEVYIEDTLHHHHGGLSSDDGDIVMEEFYIDDNTSSSAAVSALSGDHLRSTTTTSGSTTETYYVEEVIEEIVETGS